jgi:cAMP phosphodiesterase
VLSHAHLDHVAGLPLFIDDLFSALEEPIIVHAVQSVIDALENNIFNWKIYPRFSELSNAKGPVLQYRVIETGKEFRVKHLTFRPIDVNHRVPSYGYIISDGGGSIAVSGDTAEMDEFWRVVNGARGLRAILLECAFPNELEDLAEISHHLTPRKLSLELAKCDLSDCPVYVVNLKPTYREAIIDQLSALELRGLEILQVGKVYEWGSTRGQTT